MDNLQLHALLPHSSLTTRGYSINARLINPDIRFHILQWLVEKHQVQAIGHPDHKQPESWSNLKLDYVNHRWYIPRAWAAIHIGKCKFETSQDDSIDHPSSTVALFDKEIELREYQVKAFSYVSKYLTEKTPTGIVELPTAWGKSFFAIYIAKFLHSRWCLQDMDKSQFKVLVVVHNTEIGVEWQKTIRMFCTETEGLIGLIDGKHKDHIRLPDAPFMIATVQTLNNLADTASIGPFELVILDEVHHYGARTFSKVNYVINGKYMLGLSATPSRKDGLNVVLEAHLGNVFYREEVKIQPSKWTLHVHHLKFTPKVKKMYIAKTKSLEETFQSKITALAGFRPRNDYIANVILNLVRANPERRLIAFSERLEALYQLESSLATTVGSDSELRIHVYTGKEKQKGVKLEEILKESDVILTSYSIFGEGVSSDRLNGMIVVTGLAGSGRMKQPIGRVLRKAHENIDVVVVDFDDEMLPGLIYNRIKQYKERMGVSGMKQIHWKPSEGTEIPMKITSHESK